VPDRVGAGVAAGLSAAASSYVPLSPERLLDTRTGTGTPAGIVAPGSVVELDVTGIGVSQLPEDASAAVLNVTVTGTQGGGWVTVWPCGTAPPLASNLNFTAGQTVANLAVAKIGAGGRVCISPAQSATHLVVDIGGWYPATSSYVPLSPERLLDTRTGAG